MRQCHLQSSMSLSCPLFDWTNPVPVHHEPWKIPFQINIHDMHCPPTHIVQIERVLHTSTESGTSIRSSNWKLWMKETQTRFFCCACGTKIGASNCWFKMSPRFPIVKMVLLFLSADALLKIPVLPVSSMPIKSSLVTASSNFSAAKRDE